MEEVILVGAVGLIILDINDNVTLLHLYSLRRFGEIHFSFTSDPET